jgi:hypothetical protein
MWWRFGLGQTAAFCSDAKNQWGAEWIAWEHYGKFWAQVIRHVMRPSEKGSLLEIEPSADGIHVSLDARDETERFVNEAVGTATVIRPDLSKEEWTFTQTAPGRYEADIPMEESVPSVSLIQTELKLGEKVVGNPSRSVMTRYSDEWHIRPTNEALLRQLATLTGGSYQASAEEIAQWKTNRTAIQTLPLWSWLLALAAVLFVFDVLLRRVEMV